MRPSKRTEILEAAVRVAAQHGARAVTLEAVAAEDGITRGGIKYHFDDRAALTLAIQQHLADNWEQQLQETAGAPAENLSIRERTLAYVKVALQPRTPGESELVLDAATDQLPAHPWTQVQERWTPNVNSLDNDPDAPQLLLARLAVDGLWTHELLGGDDLTQGHRALLVQAMIELITDTD